MTHQVMASLENKVFLPPFDLNYQNYMLGFLRLIKSVNGPNNCIASMNAELMKSKIHNHFMSCKTKGD